MESPWSWTADSGMTGKIKARARAHARHVRARRNAILDAEAKRIRDKWKAEQKAKKAAAKGKK